MPLYLANHAHFCVASGEVVFIDLKQDRYFALPPAMRQAFKRLLTSTTTSNEDEGAVSHLVDSGLLVSCPDAGKPIQPTVCEAPTETALAQIPRTSMKWETLLALGYHLEAMMALKHNTLGQTALRLERRKCRNRTSPDIAAKSNLADIGAFLQTRRWIKTHNHCLRWSVAMVQFLASRGYYPQFVIGVRMKPFHAHAWVQDGPKVLSDEVDIVSNYTPILVI